MVDGQGRDADQRPPEPTRLTARDAVQSLLAERAPGATICPSEVARLMTGSGEEWRDAMDPVHEAVDGLQRSGAITLSWKGKPLDTRSGPYRIGRAE